MNKSDCDRKGCITVRSCSLQGREHGLHRAGAFSEFDIGQR
ncbi:MAG: hypothetical protein WB992_03090 [Bryobacteraceae bacterium]